MTIKYKPKIPTLKSKLKRSSFLQIADGFKSFLSPSNDSGNVLLYYDCCQFSSSIKVTDLTKCKIIHFLTIRVSF